MSSNTYIYLQTAFLYTLDKHAPEKKKSQRANSTPYVSNAIRIALIERSELVNKFRKQPTEANELALRKQRNYCSTLYKIDKKHFIKFKFVGHNR